MEQFETYHNRELIWGAGIYSAEVGLVSISMSLLDNRVKDASVLLIL